MTANVTPLIPMGEDVPPIFKRDGQRWLDGSPRCYKCDFFIGNMPMTGRCDETGRKVIVSGDFCKGDHCPKFQLKKEVKDYAA